MQYRGLQKLSWFPIYQQSARSSILEASVSLYVCTAQWEKVMCRIKSFCIRLFLLISDINLSKSFHLSNFDRQFFAYSHWLKVDSLSCPCICAGCIICGEIATMSLVSHYYVKLSVTRRIRRNPYLYNVLKSTFIGADNQKPREKPYKSHNWVMSRHSPSGYIKAVEHLPRSSLSQ